MLLSTPVPLPTSHISRKNRPNGTVYIYHILRSYRNKNGKPRVEEVLIGKLGVDPNYLIPNRNYYKYYTISNNKTANKDINLAKKC
jgi:hypothetical protein